MKKHLVVVIVAGATLAPVAAIAGDSYVGASVGRAETRLDVQFPSLAKDSDTGYKLYGGYRYTEILGIEGGVANLGESVIARSGIQYTVKPWSYYLAGRAVLPLNEQFELFGKVGVVRTHPRFGGVGGYLMKDTGNETSRLLGIGASFMINKQAAAVFEYEDYGRLIKEGGGSLKGKMLSAGIRYTF
jgi:OOP family OmpA-OmpF porin